MKVIYVEMKTNSDVSWNIPSQGNSMDVGGACGVCGAFLWSWPHFLLKLFQFQ